MTYQYIAYTAAWCGPCTRLKPFLNALSINQIDIDAAPEMSKQANIKGIPCVVRYDDVSGEELARVINPKPSELKAFVEE